LAKGGGRTWESLDHASSKKEKAEKNRCYHEYGAKRRYDAGAKALIRLDNLKVSSLLGPARGRRERAHKRSSEGAYE